MTFEELIELLELKDKKAKLKKGVCKLTLTPDEFSSKYLIMDNHNNIFKLINSNFSSIITFTYDTELFSIYLYDNAITEEASITITQK